MRACGDMHVCVCADERRAGLSAPLPRAHTPRALDGARGLAFDEDDSSEGMYGTFPMQEKSIYYLTQ